MNLLKQSESEYRYYIDNREFVIVWNEGWKVEACLLHLGYKLPPKVIDLNLPPMPDLSEVTDYLDATYTPPKDAQ